MKKSILSILAATALLCACNTKQTNRQTMILPDTTLTPEEIAAGVLTPEVMWKLGRVGSQDVSPDGKCVVYTVTRYSMKENKGINYTYLTNMDVAATVRLTDGEWADSDPAWSSDGKWIYFLSDRSGSQQLWKMAIDTDAIIKSNVPSPVQVTDIPDGIEGFKAAPNGDNLLYVKRVKVDSKNSSDKYPDLDKSMAKIYDGLMVRHWNRWEDGTHLHIFVTQDKNGEKITEGKDIMENEAWDAPTAPYFEMSEITWSHAGDKIAYTCKKLDGTRYALSTDSGIYIYEIASGKTELMTPDMPGYDKYPRFSPDDTKLAFTSMRRAGNEADKARLMVLDLKTKVMRDLSENFDYSAENVEWENDSMMCFISTVEGTKRLCCARPNSPEPIKQLLWGSYDINDFSMRCGTMIAQITSISSPAELFRIDPFSGQRSQFTTINSDILSHITMGKVHRRMVRTTDGKEMLTWMIVPPNFDPAKKYPTLLFCEGGPQSTISQFWSYRWNFQLMAAQGYIVIAPNRRGTPSFGQEWLDQISGDYSGQNIRDYLSAIDDACKEPFVDRDRLGCVGASYGGYSVFFLAGCHQKRFKAFISHCGMFDLESMYGTTEELWFPTNDLGGPYWSDDATAKRSYANSPHKFVKNWDTPILIITGQNDFRVPYSQSLEAFTAAQVRGIPSRLVVFENEAHQIFKPQNSLAWNREFFNWLDTYVKPVTQAD